MRLGQEMRDAGVAGGRNQWRFHARVVRSSVMSGAMLPINKNVWMEKQLWYYYARLCEHPLGAVCSMGQATIKFNQHFEYSSKHKQPEKYLFFASRVIKNSFCVYGFCKPSNYFLRLRMPKNYFCSCAIEGNISKGLRFAWPRCRTVGHLEVYYQSWNYYELIWKMV